MIFHLQLQNQIQRDRICLPPHILSWEWFQDKLRTYCHLWLVIYPKMTHHMTKHDSWHSQWRHLENDYWWIPPCSFIWLIHFSHMTYPIAFLAIFSHHYKPRSIFSYSWLTWHCLADLLICHCFLFCTFCSHALSFNWLSFLPSISHHLALL